MLNISEPQPASGFALWQLGFRPFFLGAGLFSIIAMTIWSGLYHYNWQLPLLNINTVTWHAHEMLFGYALAVIAGFLLTAVKNWTGVQTIQGYKLAIVFSCWVSARLLPLFNIGTLEILALLDCLFMLFVCIAIAIPIFKVKQWAQIGILSKIVLMLVANIIYYLGLLGIMENSERIGIYSCLYLILALIFVMGRRVIPFFIEKGINHPVKLSNPKWLDISSMVLFVALFIFDVIYINTDLTALLAAILFILHAMRLINWHNKMIWQFPMLWVLYVAYSFLTISFALKAVSIWAGISPFLSVHAFAVGGIGIMTVGLMPRVSLGHTGRNVNLPPRGLPVAFLLVLAAGIFRALLPVMLPSQYAVLIAISQILWIAAFGIFIFLFIPILIRPRADGQPG